MLNSSFLSRALHPSLGFLQETPSWQEAIYQVQEDMQKNTLGAVHIRAASQATKAAYVALATTVYYMTKTALYLPGRVVCLKFSVIKQDVGHSWQSLLATVQSIVCVVGALLGSKAMISSVVDPLKKAKVEAFIAQEKARYLDKIVLDHSLDRRELPHLWTCLQEEDITQLNLLYFSFKKEEMKGLIDMMEASGKEYVSLEICPGEKEATELLFHRLNTLSLKNLTCRGFEDSVDDQEIEKLAHALKQNTVLEKLDLSQNPEITKRGAEALGKALESNSHLRELNLRATGINGKGVWSLLRSLTQNRSLQKLNLEDCPIMEELEPDKKQAANRLNRYIRTQLSQKKITL